MSEELITHLDSRGVFTITMNRPSVHNAFDEQQIARLTDTLKEASELSAVKLVVLGAVGKHFSAGADINYMQRMGRNSREENLADASALAALMKTLDRVPKPTVAKVQGAAYGGAVGLICCCDIVIGSTSTVLSLSEVKIGLVPATIGPYVVHAIGKRAARHLFISGDRITATAAQGLGFLHHVVDDELLDDALGNVVDGLLNNSPNAMLVAKQLVFNMSMASITDDMIEQSVNTIANIRETDEAKEGLAAFLEKRRAAW